MILPLEGFRVLELSANYPGSLCTLLLADLGAEVIKIERPGGGDPGRSTPPLAKKTGVFFHMLNRNKKSLTLDIRKPQGRKILLGLSERVDVFVENSRPGNLGRLGLGYGDVAVVNPRIVYCSITGFGHDGPCRDVPAHDINFLALSGILGLIGDKGPVPAVSDITLAGTGAGGINAALGILAALLQRERTGRGQFVDAAILDGLTPFLLLPMCLFMQAGKRPQRDPSMPGGDYAFWNVYRTKDGRYISLGCWERKYWDRFCQAIGRGELSSEHHAPPQRQADVIEEIRAIFLTKTRDEWMRALDPAEICYAPVNSLEEALAHPQVRHRGLWFTATHPEDGKIPQPGFPLKLGEYRPGWRTPPPGPGEHNREILGEIGIGENELSELKTQGVI
ncbi:MAG TPA: CaiB/BaiF CoA-transferase family protein [Syntrophales bacterium]|jgi:crotonobetainyl-CoA:carnitine CoA-transferase CaiB-like acyl-CoA transferase|nr:CaiB/BaiF CoA-transferase family protein [Syntrophales bacterium]